MSAVIGRQFRVVAGIDLTPSTAQIAQAAAHEARSLGLPLVLVHALRVAPRAIGAGEPPVPLPELLISTAHWLESIAEPFRAGPEPLSVSTRVIAGRADEVLIAEALTATLIVVGEDRCGVVAAEVSHRGCAPVLVVPSRPARVAAAIGRPIR